MCTRLFDTHCHLQDPRLRDDLDDMLLRARDAGVSTLVTCGTHPRDWEATLAVALAHTQVVACLGLHPWYVDDVDDAWLGELEALLSRVPAGIGECGLDFALEVYDRERQEAALRAQLQLAHSLELPVSLHCRKAWERLLLILREEGVPAAGAVVHAFSGSKEIAGQLQQLGVHLGFGCGVANPSNRRIAAVLRAVDPDLMVFETDAPDIAPRHLPEYGGGRPNEPANLRLVLDTVARHRGESPEVLAEQVYENSLRLFGGLRHVGQGLAR